MLTINKYYYSTHNHFTALKVLYYFLYIQNSFIFEKGLMQLLFKTTINLCSKNKTSYNNKSLAVQKVTSDCLLCGRFGCSLIVDFVYCWMGLMTITFYLFVIALVQVNAQLPSLRRTMPLTCPSFFLLKCEFSKLFDILLCGVIGSSFVILFQSPLVIEV